MKLEYLLNSGNPLFAMLNDKTWWSLFAEDKELYIHIRKDNYLNVYYYGGSIAKIEYVNNSIKAIIHEKYLGGYGNKYVSLELDNLDSQTLFQIKTRIYTEYLSRKADEKCAEKWLQGTIITQGNIYVDSEFQYNRDKEIGNLRIDIVELNDGILRFVELKRIDDPRLLTDPKRNDNPAEIIEQIRRYRNFIAKYADDIIPYYQQVCGIRHNIGLCESHTIRSIDPTPKLVIIDTYKKYTTNRDRRINSIIALLNDNDIEFEIIKWK